MTDLTKLEDILPLYRLCLGNPAEVLAMVKGNPDAITWTAPDGSTLLHWMAAGNHPDCPGIIPEFLSLEGSLTLNKDQSGALPIHWAARWGSLENLVCLARLGNHEKLPRDTIGRDIMHWFAHARQDSFAGSQKLEFMTSQMAAGLDGREDRHGGTPLHWASAFGGEVGILVEKCRNWFMKLTTGEPRPYIGWPVPAFPSTSICHCCLMPELILMQPAMTEP